MKHYIDIRVRVPLDMHKRMVELARLEYSNISEISRRLWREYLEKTSQEKPR